MRTKAKHEDLQNLTDKEIASIAMLEALFYIAQRDHDYLDHLNMSKARADKVREQLIKQSRKAMVPILKYLNNRGHDVSSYGVPF